jgi:tetratricopeptide (TPR) repeat protein
VGIYAFISYSSFCKAGFGPPAPPSKPYANTRALNLASFTAPEMPPTSLSTSLSESIAPSSSLPPLVSSLVSQSKSTTVTDTQTPNVQAKAFETLGIVAAEKGNANAAIKYFSDALKMLPGSVSALNNRAQAYQLLGKKQEAMNDLNECVRLIIGREDEEKDTGKDQDTEKDTTDDDTLPSKKLKLKEKVYTQRGILLKVVGKIDEARADFEVAAKLGSDFAKSEVVYLNPIARLCGETVSELLQFEREKLAMRMLQGSAATMLPSACALSDVPPDLRNSNITTEVDKEMGFSGTN